MTSTSTTPINPDEKRSGWVPTAELLVGCIAALILLNLVMIAAGLAGVDPSPDIDVIPFIAATAALGAAALPMVRAGQRLGYWLAIGLGLLSMVGMGPHKLFLEDGGIIAPVAIVGFTAEIALIWAATRHLRVPS